MFNARRQSSSPPALFAVCPSPSSGWSPQSSLLQHTTSERGSDCSPSPVLMSSMSFPPWGRRALTGLWSLSRTPGRRTVAPTVSLAVKPSLRGVRAREPGECADRCGVSGPGCPAQVSWRGWCAPVRGFRRPQACVCVTGSPASPQVTWCLISTVLSTSEVLNEYLWDE